MRADKTKNLGKVTGELLIINQTKRLKVLNKTCYGSNGIVEHNNPKYATK